MRHVCTATPGSISLAGGKHLTMGKQWPSLIKMHTAEPRTATDGVSAFSSCCGFWPRHRFTSSQSLPKRTVMMLAPGCQVHFICAASPIVRWCRVCALRVVFVRLDLSHRYRVPLARSMVRRASRRSRIVLCAWRVHIAPRGRVPSVCVHLARTMEQRAGRPWPTARHAPVAACARSPVPRRPLGARLALLRRALGHLCACSVPAADTLSALVHQFVLIALVAAVVHPVSRLLAMPLAWPP